MSAQRKVDGKTIIPDVVSAVCGTGTLRQATRALGQEQRDSLSRAIKMDVDEWRAEFAQQLRATAQELLAITRRDIEMIKPDARGYTIAVLVDKANAIEGRNQVHAASVNIQVNNFGPQGKDELLASLDGRAMAKAALQAQAPTSGAIEPIAADTDT